MKTFCLITFGCQMNISDSERIAAVMKKIKLKPASKNEANLIIFNLCSVRQKSVDKVWGMLKSIKTLKHKNIKTKPIVIATGCILPEDKKKFAEKVDLVLDIKNLNDWPEIIRNYELRIMNHGNNKKNDNYLSIIPNYNSEFQAYVPIMTGCNNFCSYCAVPYVRGREISRPTKEVVEEVNKLVAQGYKFITLLGQNVNSYEDRTQKNIIDFTKLLKLVDSVSGDFWLSFATSHPKDMSGELIKCFKNCKHLIPYLHLPLQAGADKTLKAMNRKYTAKKYLELIKKIRGVNPDINISTDIIVGFPGETKTDFEKTAEMMKKIKFDMAYLAEYSPRSGTAAAKMKNDVAPAEKHKRYQILNEILKKTALENNKKMIGKTTEVLIESTKGDACFGRTRNFKNIKIKGDKNKVGDFIKVKVAKANPWNLEGKLII